VSFDPTTKVPQFPPRGEADPAVTRLVGILDFEKFKRQYLFGLRLKDTKTNQELTPDDLKDFIANAISRIEHEARIDISPVKYTDLLDYNPYDYRKFCFLQLNHWPVIQVQSVKAQFPGSTDYLQFPTEWIVCQNESGLLQIAPRSGIPSQIAITNGSGLMPLIVMGSGAGRWPQLFEVVYTAGFDYDKIPAIMRDLIGLYASISVLELLDTSYYQGSYSIGIDGASQSVGLPGPGWLQSRIQQNQARADKLLDVIKHAYNHSLLFSSL
jgi:hypothetical protein